MVQQLNVFGCYVSMNKNDHWVLLSDTKPVPFEHVLIYSETEGILVGYYKNEDSVFVNPVDGSYLTNITHWQALPAPPVPRTQTPINLL